jgi:hypothetical protein
MEIMPLLCQAVKWKDERVKSCYFNGKVVLAPLDDPPQEFKHFLKPHYFWSRIGPTTAYLHVRPWVHLLRKMPGLMSNWRKLKNIHTSSTKSTTNGEICSLVGYYKASCGNCLPRFRDNVSVPYPRIKSPRREESRQPVTLRIAGFFSPIILIIT